MTLLNKYVAQFVYGAFDGIVTTFAVVAAGMGANLSSKVIVILGLANLFADGFSMGSSAFLSHQSERKKRRKKSTNDAPFRMAFATFMAFVIVGFVPVFPYVLNLMGILDIAQTQLFIVSAIMTLAAFILLGYMKARGSRSSIAYSITETLVLGIVAASLAYLVGAVLESIFNPK